eukprot:462718-Pelagomonas_calceolata.AAC.1
MARADCSGDSHHSEKSTGKRTYNGCIRLQSLKHMTRPPQTRPHQTQQCNKSAWAALTSSSGSTMQQSTNKAWWAISRAANFPEQHLPPGSFHESLFLFSVQSGSATGLPGQHSKQPALGKAPPWFPFPLKLQSSSATSLPGWLSKQPALRKALS